MHPRNVWNNIKDYYEQSLLCPRNVIDYKPKREHDITKATQYWDKSYNTSTLVNQLNCSYILGCNEYIVAPFITECAQLLACIEHFENKNKQQMKGCSEVTSYYTDLFRKIDKSQFVGWVLADLEYWSNTYSIEIDKKQIVERFKQEKSNHLEKLK